MTKPDIPDRTFKIVGRDPDGTPHLRPCHDGMTVCEDDEFVTLRSYIVGEDGLTSVERELQNSQDERQSLEDVLVHHGIPLPEPHEEGGFKGG